MFNPLLNFLQDWKHLHIADILSMPDKYVAQLQTLAYTNRSQVGIPLLRGMGHGFPLHPSRRCGSRFR